MVFATLRRIGRVFSIVLLVWTTVDLIDHNVCTDHAAGVPSTRGAAVGQAVPVQAPAIPHVDHSFCCSQTVDVQTPFRIALTFHAVGLLQAESPALRSGSPGSLYHPPLATS